MANLSSHSWRAAAAIARANPPRTADRALPALDYGEASSRTRISPPRDSLVDLSRGGPKRAGRASWFVSGLLLGALVVATAHGDFDAPLRGIRAWTASTLRALRTTGQEPTHQPMKE